MDGRMIWLSIVIIIISQSVLVISSGEQTYENDDDDIDNAILIQDKTYEGSLSLNDRNDYYKFIIEKGKTINIIFKSDSYTGLILSLLCDVNRTLFELSSSNNSIENGRFHTDKDSITYIFYINIWFMTSPGNYEFSLNFTPQNDCEGRSDASGKIENAQKIGPGQYSGMLGDFDVRDHFRIDEGKGSILSISFLTDIIDYDMTIRISNNDIDYQRTEYITTELRDIEIFTSYETPISSFYIRIENKGREMLYYLVISIRRQNDANYEMDAPSGWSTLLEVIPSVRYNGLLKGMDMRDSYKFRTEPGYIYTLFFTTTSISGQSLEIYSNSSGNLIKLYTLNSKGSRRESLKFCIDKSQTTSNFLIDIKDNEGSYEFIIEEQKQNDANSMNDAIGSSSKVKRSLEAIDLPEGHHTGYMNMNGDIMDSYSIRVKKDTRMVLQIDPNETLAISYVLIDDSEIIIDNLENVLKSKIIEIVIDIDISKIFHLNLYVGDGEGNYSIIIDFINIGPEVKLPDPPKIMSSMKFEDRLFFDWEPPIDDGGSDISGYKIYKGSSPYNLIEIATIKEGKTYFFDEEVFWTFTYYYRLSSLNYRGEGEQSQLIVITLDNTEWGADTDMDGMPDRWEILFGFDRLDPDDAWEDPDNDGIVNYYEYLYGTNPLISDKEESRLSRFFNKYKDRIFIIGSALIFIFIILVIILVIKKNKKIDRMIEQDKKRMEKKITQVNTHNRKDMPITHQRIRERITDNSYLNPDHLINMKRLDDDIIYNYMNRNSNIRIIDKEDEVSGLLNIIESSPTLRINIKNSKNDGSMRCLICLCQRQLKNPQMWQLNIPQFYKYLTPPSRGVEKAIPPSVSP